MRSTIKTLLCSLPALALITTALVTDFSSYARAAETALNETQKAEVRQIIKEYMRENPEIVIESFKAFQDKQQAESIANAQVKIKEFASYLTGSNMPSAGNPKGSITVIEFFDYNCGYCKKAIGDIKNIIETDKDVRFVFIEMPILGPSSLTAAQWAHAAQRQGKYFEFHTALMEHNGAIEDSVLEETAKKVGMDLEKAKADAGSSEVAEEIQKGMQIGGQIGVQGTPGFIVEDQLYPGYLGEEGLKTAIKEKRDAKKS